MTEPKRLLEEMEPGLARELLAAGARERAPEGARERVHAGVLALAVIEPLGAGAKAGGSLFGGALSWLAVGAVAGGLTGGVASELSRAEPAAVGTSVPTRAPVTAPAPAVKAEPAAPRPQPAAEPRKTSRAPATATGSVLIGTPSLSLEAQSLDRIRRLAKRDPRRALALLDEHEARFQHGSGAARSLRAEIRTKLEKTP